MKNVILSLLLFVALSGCVTQQKCLNKFPPEVITKDSISYVEKTVLKDTIVYVKTPADTVRIKGPVPVLSTPPIEPLTIDTVSIESSKSIAYSWVNKNIMGMTIIDKPMQLSFNLQNSITTIGESRNTTIKEVVKARFIPKFYKICTWSLIGLFLIGLVCLYFKAKTDLLGKIKSLIKG